MLKSRNPKNLLLAGLLLTASLASHAATAETKQPKQRSILGWVEYVDIMPWGLHTKAKLDTGAKTSSMHAKDIEIFEKKGKDWARFTFEYTEKKGGKLRRPTIEAPVKRYVLIKRHKNKTQRRPVVELELCIDNAIYKTQFSLIDRTRFIYPVLLGRRLLKEAALVDANNTFLGQKVCKLAKKQKN